MRLYVTEMHINKSYQGSGSSAIIRSSDLMENTILIYYNKDCQRKNPDPTTGMTIQSSCAKQTFSKL